MRKREQIGLDFEVDKLTNSIENVVSGDKFATHLTLISTELDVDFIGGQDPMTKEEEKGIGQFIKMLKLPLIFQ